jgi:hypothetical protein
MPEEDGKGGMVFNIIRTCEASGHADAMQVPVHVHKCPTKYPHPCTMHQKRLAITNVANDSAQGGYKREESSRNRKGNEKDWAESPRRSSTKNIRIR